MEEKFDVKFHRVIFCGSVVQYEFPFENIQSRFTPPIVNEVGTRDVWPAIAESVTTGYGSAGTYGFHRPLVEDRWHNGARHGFFLNAEFCEKFWIPFLNSGTFIEGPPKPERPRVWLQVLSIVKIKYALLALLGIFLFDLGYANRDIISDRLFGVLSPSPVNVPDPRTVGTVHDLVVALRKIESRKGTLSRTKIKQISTALTLRLISADEGAVTRLTARAMNYYIVITLAFLNNKDLSDVWRQLPPNIDLSYVDLNGVDLRGVRFEKTFFIYTNFTGAQLDDEIFDNYWVRNADYSGTELSNTSFPDTDWFNALNVLQEKKMGWPLPFDNWRDCPDNYKAEGQFAFIKLFDNWYGAQFHTMTPQDAGHLLSAWAGYSKDGGLCDQVQQAQ